MFVVVGDLADFRSSTGSRFLFLMKVSSKTKTESFKESLQRSPEQAPYLHFIAVHEMFSGSAAELFTLTGTAGDLCWREALNCIC